MTDEQVEAALCLWEAMLEAKLPEDAIDGGDENSWRFKLQYVWETVGTSEMRLSCIETGKQIDAAWQAMTEDERAKFDTFDWDFVPDYLQRALSGDDGEIWTMLNLSRHHVEEPR